MKSSSDKSTSQFIRYLLVGGFNTAFGYGLFALLNWLFRGLGSFSYMYAWFLANVVAITGQHFWLTSGSCSVRVATT